MQDPISTEGQAQQAQPQPTTDFSVMLKNALSSQQFHDLTADQQKQVLWKMMDRDERTATLDDEQRSLVLNKTFSKIGERAKQAQDEYEQVNRPSSRMREALQNPLANQLMPGASMLGDLIKPEGNAAAAVDTVADAPIVRDVLSAARSGLGGTLAAAEGVAAQAPLIRGMLERPGISPLPMPVSVEANAPEMSVQMTMRAMRNTLEQVIPQSDKLVRSWEQVDGPVKFMEWALGNTADSVAYLAPVLATAILTRGTSLPGGTAVMGAQFAGESAAQQIEESGSFNPVIADAVAAASTVLEEAFGPGSAMAKAPMNFIRKLANMGTKEVVKDIVKGGVGETVTEVLQQYIDEQAAEWSNEDYGFWKNLEPEERRGIAEAGALGFFMGGMFEGYRGTKTLASGDTKVAQRILKRYENAQLSPEQRGEKGILSVMTRPELTDQMKEEIRIRQLSGLDFLNEEQVNQFVRQEPITGDLTSEQMTKLQEADTRARQLTEGPETTPVEIQGEQAELTLKGIREHIKAAIDRNTTEGNTATAAKNQKAFDTLHFVEPKDPAWEEMRAFAKKHFGVDMLVFDHEGSSGIGGIYSTAGVVAVEARNYANMGTLGLLVHEATHNLQNTNPTAYRGLQDYIAENFPEEWEAAKKYVEEQTGRLYENSDQASLDRERMAYFMQGKDLIQKKDGKVVSDRSAERVRLIVQALTDYETFKEKGQAPRGLRKFAEWVYKTLKDWASKNKFIQNITQIDPKDPDPEVIRKVHEFGAKVAEYFQETAKGTTPQAEKSAAAPRTPISKPGKPFTRPANSSAVQAQNFQVGDVITIEGKLNNRPGEVVSHRVETLGKEKPVTSVIMKVKMNDGTEVDLLVPRTKVGYVIRKAKNAPETAPTTETTEKPKAPPKAKAPPKPQAPEGNWEEVPSSYLRVGDTVRYKDKAEGVIKGLKQRKDGKIAFNIGSAWYMLAPTSKIERIKTDQSQSDIPVNDAAIVPERLTVEELEKVKQTDYYKNALKAAENGDWEEVDPVTYHNALNSNTAAVTLTPYTVEQLSDSKFKLFRLKGTQIYVAVNGKDAVGGINNDIETLPGIASNAFMLKVIEEGCETADCFNVTKPGQTVGFLPERYMRFGWRFATTEEMPQWAQDAGGRHGVLPFSREAYLSEHSEQDLEDAQAYWDSQSGQKGTQPDVVFLVWDPPPGITRANIREQYKKGNIGTKEVARRQIANDKSIQPIVDAIDAAHSFKGVSKQEYKDGGGSPFGETKPGVTYWHIYDDDFQESKINYHTGRWEDVKDGDWVRTKERVGGLRSAPVQVRAIQPAIDPKMEGYLEVIFEDNSYAYYRPDDIVKVGKRGEAGPKRVGRFEIRERFAGTEDHDLYFEWIDSYDSPKQKQVSSKTVGVVDFGGLGVRGTIALGRLLQKNFPGALWVAGYRAGAAHQTAARTGKGNAHVRVPLYSDSQIKKLGITMPPNRTEAELTAIHGGGRVLGYNDEYWEDKDGPTDEELEASIEEYDIESLDEQIAQVNDLLDSWGDAAIEIDHTQDDAAILPVVTGQSAASIDEMRKWSAGDWTAYGDKYGVPNLGGMSDLVQVGKVQVPGGTEGTWTFQELHWMQSQAWNPEEVWTEEEHVGIQRKLSRTLTPPKPDPLQALNGFIFSMISPSTNLTLNEMSYALRRMRTEEEVRDMATRIPWDITKGEVAGRETYEKRMTEEQQEDFRLYAKERRKIDDIDALTEGQFTSLMRLWADENLNKFTGVIRKDEGGIGAPGSGKGSDIAELCQLWLSDPEWFLKKEEESWLIFAQRLASQAAGISHKVAIFGAVWQDPLFAAVAAIDRHMAFIWRDSILGTGDLRVKLEESVMKEWRKKNPDSDAENMDDVIIEKGGVGLVTKVMADLVQSPLTPVYNLSNEEHRALGEFIVDPKKLQLMSDAYKRALEYNLQEAERLGLGVFATQHLKWDRQRQRFETHYMMFPEAYKLPKQTADGLRDHMARLYSDKWITTKKVEVDVNGEKELRLMRPRIAPPGDLPMAAEAEAPSAFERGSRTRSSIVDARMSHPSTVTNPNGGPLWLIPETKWWHRARIKFQDKFLRVFHMQGAVEKIGGRITDDTDVYLHELLYHGRVAAAVEIFEEDYVKPLMDYIREKDIDIDEFEEYLEARHTGERNDHLTDIWYRRRKARLQDELQAILDEIELGEESENFDDTVLRRRYDRKKKQLEKLEEKRKNNELPIAGMTNDEAAKIVAQAGTKFDGAAELFDTMMKQKLQILFDAGLISEEEMKRVSIYQYYVPLKGKEYDGDLETLLDDIGAGTGSGFDIRGDELGVAMGRVGGSRATHPIISQAVVDIESAIVRVEKNIVGQAMLDFVEEFPNTDLYEVNKMVGRRVWDSKNKEAKLVRDKWGRKAPNVLAVKRDGETFYIHMKDARLARALKNIGNPSPGPVLKVFAFANRLMARLNTTLNPEFMISNFIRDLQTAMVSLSDKEAQGLMLKTMANLPGAMRGIAGGEFSSVSDTEWTEWYDRFRKAGGKIGFFGYNDVISKAKSIDNYIKRQGPGAHRWTARQMAAFGSMVEKGNAVVENGIRLAAFRTAVEAGMSEKRAAALARRLTVNFNKKGEAGSTMNAIWLFSNASIQGTARMFQALYRSKRVRWIAASQVITAATMSALGRAMGGDDDEDGYSYYEKIPDWQKETNAIFMIPGGKGDHIKIPLSYGYNVFWVAGVQVEKILHKTATGTLKPGDLWAMGVTMADSILSAFNPLGATRLDSSWGLFRIAVPSIAAPIADTLVNETYYGSPIQPPRSSWDKSPNSQRYFKSVSSTSRMLADWANEVTGGNHYQPGWADLNPEVLDYLISSYSGAGAKTAMRMFWDLPKWALASDHKLSEVEIRDVAFLRRVYGEENNYTVSAMFYENAEEIEQAEEAWSNMKSDPSIDIEGWKDKHGWKLKVVRDLKRATKAIRAAKTDEEKDKARKEFNRAYRLAWLSQF